MKIGKLILFLVASLFLITLFWYAVIPGIIFGLFVPKRFARFTTLIVSGGITFLIRVATGSPNPGIVFNFDGGIVYLIIEFIIGWMFCGLLFYAGFQAPKSYVEGRRSTVLTKS